MRRRPQRINFEAIHRLLEAADFTTAVTVRAVCALGIPDAIGCASPRELEQVAAETGTHAPTLLRALRCLVASGLLLEPSPGRFALTERGERLQRGHPSTAADGWPLFAWEMEAWGALDQAVSDGVPGLAASGPGSLWGRLAADAALRGRFKAAEGQHSRHDLQQLRGCCLGLGPVAGTVVDLWPPDDTAAGPDVVAYGDRYRQRIPPDGPLPAAEVYLLRRWLVWLDDAAARATLGFLSEALALGTRLLVVEPQLSAHRSGVDETDLRSLVLSGGGVRHPEALEDLLASAGLTPRRQHRHGDALVVEVAAGR